MTVATPCGLTVLRTLGNRTAAKRWQWDEHQRQWRKIDYQAGFWFTAAEHQVSNLSELAAVLEQVASDPRSFVVRGALTPEIREAVAANPQHQVRRRKHAKDGVAPTLAEVVRYWIMIDIDNWPLRPFDDLASDPGAAIDHAIYELLPEAFHDAECWWQLSSSAGFVPGILKAHLFFWLSEPADNAHVKRVLEQHAPAVVYPAAPHMQVHQVVGNWGKAALCSHPKKAGTSWWAWWPTLPG